VADTYDVAVLEFLGFDTIARVTHIGAVQAALVFEDDLVALKFNAEMMGRHRIIFERDIV